MAFFKGERNDQFPELAGAELSSFEVTANFSKLNSGLVGLTSGSPVSHCPALAPTVERSSNL